MAAHLSSFAPHPNFWSPTSRLGIDFPSVTADNRVSSAKYLKLRPAEAVLN